MPGNVAIHQGKYTTLRINDFTSGIVSQDYSHQKSDATIGQRIPSSGQNVTSSINSYGVTGLPNGGLLFGPAVFATSTIGTAPYPADPAHTVISGLAFKYSGLTTSTSEPLVYFTISAYETLGASAVPIISLCQYKVTSFTDLADAPGNAGPPQAMMPTFLDFVVLADGSNIYEYLMFSGPPSFGIGVPILNEAATFSNMLASQARNGVAVPLGGRVWFFEGNEGLIFFIAGEPEYVAISFTDPTTLPSVDNRSIGTQATLVDYETPSSFGAWGQIISGEVVLIKKTGGGVVISGDIYSPSVTKIPAVQSTDGLFGISPITPIGLVYRSKSNGVWAWNGGSQSQKISAQISDSAWVEAGGISGIPAYTEANYLTPFDGLYFYNMQQIGNFLLTDSGLFMDFTTSAWWRLPPYLSSTAVTPPQVAKFFAPTSGIQDASDFMSLSIDQSLGTVIKTQWIFDPGQVTIGDSIQAPPTDFYHSFWESNPLQLSDDNMVEVQELNVVMQGFGSLNVSTLGVDGQVLTSNSVSVANSSFKKVRITTKFLTDVIIIQLGWTNQTPNAQNVTPLIESVGLNYRDRFPVPVAN